MHWLFLSTTLLVSSLLSPQLFADEPPKPLTVEAELETEPEFIHLSGGGSRRSNIDRVIAATPPEIAAAVEDWTGISDRGTNVIVALSHYPHSAFVLQHCNNLTMVRPSSGGWEA